MTPEEINKQSAVMEAVIRDLERAQLLDKGIDKTALMKALLDPNVTTEDEKDFVRLQQLGDPDKVGEKLDPDTTVFGQDADLVRSNMHREFKGRGWVEGVDYTPDKPPAAMQLSPGGKQADEYRRRRDLIQGVTSPTMAQKIGQYIPDWLLSTASSAPTSLDRYFDDPVKAFEGQRDRDYGTSGFTGAMENPEYGFGWYSNNTATPISDTIQYMSHDGLDIQSAAEAAEQRRQAMAMGKGVDPILPNIPGVEYDRDARETALGVLRELPESMRPMNGDMSFRKKHGYYPSYLDSGVSNFAENIPDALTAVTTAIGIPMGPKAFASWFGKELLEEAPQYAAVASAFKASAGDEAPPTPQYSDWGQSRGVGSVKSRFGESSPEYLQARDRANNARTDLYIRDSETKKFRPETDEEFDKSYQDIRDRQRLAFQEFNRNAAMMPGSKPK